MTNSKTFWNLALEFILSFGICYYLANFTTASTAWRIDE